MLAITLLVPNPLEMGSVTCGPAGLDPGQIKLIVLHFPADRKPAGQGGKAAVFRRVGDELMQGERERLRRCRLQLNLGTVVLDLTGFRIGCDFLGHQPADFRSLPARQREYGMNPRQRRDAAFDGLNIGIDVSRRASAGRSTAPAPARSWRDGRPPGSRRVWRSSARLRSVMSTVTPLTRTTRPLLSTVAAAVPTHQRTSPSGRAMRNSAS